MKRPAIAILFLSFSLLVALSDPALGQSLDKMRLGYSGTGLNNYVLEMGRRTGIFRKNGLDLEVVYETVEYAMTRSIQVLATRPFPTVAGIQTVLDELGKETKVKSSKLEDFVDLRALRELEKEGVFK
jgi:ABC-type nitrate/sulfonate/bicarbonate transport system substrate-binding protein